MPLGFRDGKREQMISTLLHSHFAPRLLLIDEDRDNAVTTHLHIDSVIDELGISVCSAGFVTCRGRVQPGRYVIKGDPTRAEQELVSGGFTQKGAAKHWVKNYLKKHYPKIRIYITTGELS